MRGLSEVALACSDRFGDIQAWQIWRLKHALVQELPGIYRDIEVPELAKLVKDQIGKTDYCFGEELKKPMAPSTAITQANVKDTEAIKASTE